MTTRPASDPPPDGRTSRWLDVLGQLEPGTVVTWSTEVVRAGTSSNDWQPTS